MGSIPSTPAPTAVSVLTAPGAPLSRFSSLVPQSVVNSANPTDLASLSIQAASLSEANWLYGGWTPDSFQSSDSFQPSNPGLSVLNAAYGLTPASPATPDLLQQGLDRLNGNGAKPSASLLSSPTLEQSLLSLFGDGASSRGNLVDILG